MKNNQWDDSHRQWPLPQLPWTMRQNWNDLLFAHYPVKLEVLKKFVPDVLPLDSYDGMGWVGVVPFRITGLRLRGLPPFPGTDRFPELNIRTYVSVDGKPGVYFFSLDAANQLAVSLANTFYHLPYIYADIRMRDSAPNFHFESKRRGDEAEFVCSYRPISEPYHAEKGSFDEWMVERYCFYTLNRQGMPLRCDILHQPWSLQNAEAEIERNTMLSELGIQVESEQPATLHFAKVMEVRAWPLVHALKDS